MIKHFKRNTTGKDYAVGDIHGCFSRLQAHLDYIGFEPAHDRLFSVGDLVDRGLESELSLEWLAKPWFHAVRGNHEQMAIDAASGFMDQRIYIANGGAWFLGMTQPERGLFADAFSMLPIAIDVETEAGLIGIVHAECPVADWAAMEVSLNGRNAEGFQQQCMWNRDRISYQMDDNITGVRAVVVGHTPLERFTSLGNVLYIDTGAVFRGREFTILDLETLRPVKLAAQIHKEAA